TWASRDKKSSCDASVKTRTWEPGEEGKVTAHQPQTRDPAMKRIFLLFASLLTGACLAADDAAPTEIKGHTALVYGVAFSPDGKILATAGFDSAIKLWDTGTWKEIRTLSGHTGPVYSVVFSPDGAQLASSSHDQTIRLWNVADGAMVKDMKG